MNKTKILNESFVLSESHYHRVLRMNINYYYQFTSRKKTILDSLDGFLDI